MFNGANSLGTIYLKNHLDKYHLFLKNATTKDQQILQVSLKRRSEEHTSEPSHSGESRMPSSA